MIARLLTAILFAAGASAPATAMPAGLGETDPLENVTVQIDGTPHVQANRIASFVLARESIGTELSTLTYKEGGWTVRVRNVYKCVTSVPIDCRTFPTAYFLINDQRPLRISGWGLP